MSPSLRLRAIPLANLRAIPLANLRLLLKQPARDQLSLKVQKNRLVDISSLLEQVPDPSVIEVLDLSLNRIQTLEGIQQFTKLKSLNLSQNLVISQAASSVGRSRPPSSPHCPFVKRVLIGTEGLKEPRPEA